MEKIWMIPNNGGEITGIYCISNNTTGQLYIGQSLDINRRYNAHCKQPTQYSYIDKAIQKYGPNNFTLTILAVTSQNKEVLDWLEKLYIKAYNTYQNNFHYNLTPGGESLPGESNPRYREDIPSSQELYDEWKSGVTHAELCEKYNCGEATIKRRIRKVNKDDGRVNTNVPPAKMLFDEWQNGTTQKELSEKYCCSISHIEHIIRGYKEDNGITDVKTNHGKHSHNLRSDIPKGPELIDEINKTQMTYKQIAEKYNCTESLINHRIRKTRNKKILKHYHHVPNGEELLKEYEESNYTQRELSEKYNCSIHCIKNRIRYARKKRVS